MIVLDASLAIDWLFGTGAISASSDVDLTLSTSSVMVPAHWPLEISNTQHQNLRDNRISIADFQTIMERPDRLNIRVQAPIDLDEMGPLSHFAVAHHLTSYDAAYVQLALHYRAMLATLDNAMRRAANTLNIPLLPA